MTKEEFKAELLQPKSVECQFDFYLKQMKLDQKTMSDIQFIETRRAFYAGFGQMAILFMTRVGDLPEDEGVEEIQSILTEVAEFMVKEKNL